MENLEWTLSPLGRFWPIRLKFFFIVYVIDRFTVFINFIKTVRKLYIAYNNEMDSSSVD